VPAHMYPTRFWFACWLDISWNIVSPGLNVPARVHSMPTMSSYLKSDPLRRNVNVSSGYQRSLVLGWHKMGGMVSQ